MSEMIKRKNWLKTEIISNAALRHMGVATDEPWIEMTVSENIFDEIIDEMFESLKPTIPQYVANWIVFPKREGFPLNRALDIKTIAKYENFEKVEHLKLVKYLQHESNQEKLARSWLDEDFYIDKEDESTFADLETVKKTLSSHHNH